jgi:hypothetical protein
MHYFDEGEVIKRVRQRIRRRFLFWSHFLLSLAVIGFNTVAIHQRYVRNAASGLTSDYWSVGGWMYTYEITTMLSAIGFFLLLHLLYFLYRETMTRAVHREMAALYADRQSSAPMQAEAGEVARKQKRDARLSLSDDGEFIVYADEDESRNYPPEYREQWQRN